MSDVIDKIKRISHRVAEDYLTLGKDMNENLIEIHSAGEIQNPEVLKRICEQCNQNVYLSLFNDPAVNKKDIKFDIADFDYLSNNITQSEKSMNDYGAAPDDFRSELELAVSDGEEKTASDLSPGELEKKADLNNLLNQRQIFKNLLNSVGSIKCAELKSAEESFNRMAHDAKVMVTNGDSLGDITKIASRFVKEDMGLGFTKVAKAYDIIHKDLIDNQFHVNTEFTKISSMHINKNSPALKPVVDFALSIEKVAAITEMEENISRCIEVYNNMISEVGNG